MSLFSSILCHKYEDLRFDATALWRLCNRGVGSYWAPRSRLRPPKYCRVKLTTFAGQNRIIDRSWLVTRRESSTAGTWLGSLNRDRIPYSSRFSKNRLYSTWTYRSVSNAPWKTVESKSPSTFRLVACQVKTHLAYFHIISKIKNNFDLTCTSNSPT